MKAKDIITIPMLGIALCCSNFSLIAQQDSSPSAAVVSSAGGGQPIPSQTAESIAKLRATERIAKLGIPKGSLSDAVKAVDLHLPKDEESMNVIFVEDAESQPVPALTLRNVTGPDALMLIAAAADVQVEPIRGLADGRYIGFRLSPRQRPSRQESMMMPGAMYGNTAAADGGGAVVPSGSPNLPGIAARIVASGTAPGGAGDVGSSGGRAPVVRGSSYRGYGGGGMAPGASGGGSPYGSTGASVGRPSSYGMTGSADADGVGAETSGRLPGVRTHVYPLAEITPFVELNEVQKTLHDLLKAGGASEDDAKLAFHEKTGVLVARAPEKVQELIQELLRALAQNNAETRETNATREWAQMQVKLDSLTRQLARTEEEMLRNERRAEEAEALARQYANELRQRKESQGNP